MGKTKYSLEELKSKFKERHGESLVIHDIEGTKMHSKVHFSCAVHPEHGSFKHKIYYFLNSNGCPKCRRGCPKCSRKGHSYLNHDHESLCEIFRATHGDRYDYSLSEYCGWNCKVKIICKEHGVFEQTYHNHRKGDNCPKCRSYPIGQSAYIQRAMKENKEDYLKRASGVYCLRISIGEEAFIKVGITNYLKRRLQKMKDEGCHTEVLTYVETNLYDALRVEQDILRIFEGCRFESKTKFAGHSECLTLDVEDKILKYIEDEFRVA